jgi:hypothetical protein
MPVDADTSIAAQIDQAVMVSSQEEFFPYRETRWADSVLDGVLVYDNRPGDWGFWL